MADINIKFKSYTDNLFKTYLELYPQTGFSLGLHEYDGKISGTSSERISSNITVLKKLLYEIKEFNPDELSNENKFDYELSVWGLESEIFEQEEIQSFKKNPMHYAFMFSDLHNYISREYAPFEERIQSVIKIIGAIPSAIDDAIQILDKDLPRVLCRYARHFALGYEDFFKGELFKLIKEKISDEKIISDYTVKSTEAVSAFNMFVDFLEKASNENNLNYRLGKEKFERMLKIKEHVDISSEELKLTGITELKRLQNELNELLQTNNFQDKLETLEHSHPSEESLISETEGTLGELVDFLKEKNIVNVPDKLNCIVTEMPKYMNFGFAAMGTAGPFEKSDESFYYVNLPESDWSPEKREQWMTQFNYPTLKLISIHEAYPGHYIHFLNSNMNSTRMSKLFMSYSYIEGWAHYTEEMMIECGYDEGNFKTKIGQLLEALIRCCRYIVAIGIHCEGMTIEEAKKFFLDNAYMTETTALQEAERGAFDPGYLNYTLGKIMLKNLKAEFFNKFGNSKSLREFHDSVISLGAPTYKIAKKYILGNKIN